MAQGGELLSNYGFKSNEELLAGYGFALGPRNPADFFHIALRLGPARSGARPIALAPALGVPAAGTSKAPRQWCAARVPAHVPAAAISALRPGMCHSTRCFQCHV